MRMLLSAAMNPSPLHLLILLTVIAAAIVSMLSARAPDSELRSAGFTGASRDVKLQSAAAFPDKSRNDYEPLSFDEVFLNPAGPKGLEYTPKIKALDGRKVCISGFMVRHADSDTSAFLFCATPRVYNEREEGLADSLPPNMVYVTMQVRENEAPAWRREKMTLYGTLELGSHQELSGRVSHLRLRCDAVTDGQTGDLIEVRRPVAFQLERSSPPPSDVGALTPPDTPTPFFNPRRNRNQTQIHPDKP